MLAACQSENMLNLTMWHPSEVIVLAHNHPIFPVRVLQSASHMRDIAESTVCLTVPPFRGTICAIGPLREGFRVNQGHAGPVEVQILLSPLNRATMDLGLFRLAVDEVTRASRDQKWSIRTAVRSYIRNAALKPERYRKEKAKLRLGNQLSERWAGRPICSTVPPRIWQKYFPKQAYKERRASSRARGHSVAGNFSAEAAFAEYVLRYAPVKDDRVLPEDLVTILLGTGAWDVLDLQGGPPPRRRNDHQPKEPWCQIPPCKQRMPLPAGLTNRDGRPAFLGADQFTVYCGAQVSRPKTGIKTRLSADGEPPQPEVISWDGRCGPLQGPQCAACRWLEDRLFE